ncbi:MAG: hypothetical protein GTO63_11175 [Anaerolineae bacterium]|nr:hypothetical protein [Anaerolineae bacterium]NIN95430.1 hypothetical protein [Anaerolineae bacterium]NIQ78397.1 hypothetical protein [Anaerolineae bacterium]
MRVFPPIPERPQLTGLVRVVALVIWLVLSPQALGITCGAIVTADADPGGTISPSGQVEIPLGGVQFFVITANEGFLVSRVTVDGFVVGLRPGPVFNYTFLSPWSDFCSVSYHSVYAYFVRALTVTASAGPGGTISFAGVHSYYPRTDSHEFDITPDEGFITLDVLVDGVSVGAVSSYIFRDLSTDHTIEAHFLEVFPAIAPALDLILDDN